MKSLATLVAVLALGTIAYAADEPAKPAAPAPVADGAKKPKMSPEDAFKKLDKDNNGELTLAEYKASPRGQKDPAKAEEMYKKMDAKGTGKVTLAEFTAAMQHGKKKKDK